MAKKKSAPRLPKKPPTALRAVVGANFRAMLIERHGQQSEDKWQELIKWRTGSFNRILNGKNSVTLETLAKVAAIAGVEPYQMLVEIKDAKKVPTIGADAAPLQATVDPVVMAGWQHLEEKDKKHILDLILDKTKTKFDEAKRIVDAFQHHHHEAN